MRIKNRRLARETILQALFQIDVGKQEPQFALQYLLDNNFLPAEANLTNYTREVLNGVLQNLAVIDPIIQNYSQDWTLERMPRVDRNVLRLSLYELLYRPDIPVAVSINEAVDLVKAFGGEESGKFVNGILGKFVNSEHYAKLSPRQD